MDEFQQVRDILLGRSPIPSDLAGFRQTCHRRLLDAVRRLDEAKGEAVGRGDLAVLLRHALGRERARTGGKASWLPFRKSWAHPTEEGWGAYSLRARDTRDADDYLAVEALPWAPDWPGAAGLARSPEWPLLEEEPRRYDGTTPLPDPFLGDALKHTGYHNAAPRQWPKWTRDTRLSKKATCDSRLATSAAWFKRG